MFSILSLHFRLDFMFPLDLGSAVVRLYNGLMFVFMFYFGSAEATAAVENARPPAISNATSFFIHAPQGEGSPLLKRCARFGPSWVPLYGLCTDSYLNEAEMKLPGGHSVYDG